MGHAYRSNQRMRYGQVHHGSATWLFRRELLASFHDAQQSLGEVAEMQRWLSSTEIARIGVADELRS